jgi:hypothetical protein
MTITILLALVAATLAALLFIATGAYRDLAAELRTADALAIEQARRANAVRAELAEEIGLRRRLGRCVVEQQAQLNEGQALIDRGLALINQQQQIIDDGADNLMAAIVDEVDRMDADEPVPFIPAEVTPIHDGTVVDLFREQLGRPSETWMGWDE